MTDYDAWQGELTELALISQWESYLCTEAEAIGEEWHNLSWILEIETIVSGALNVSLLVVNIACIFSGIQHLNGHIFSIMTGFFWSLSLRTSLMMWKFWMRSLTLDQLPLLKSTQSSGELLLALLSHSSTFTTSSSAMKSTGPETPETPEAPEECIRFTPTAAQATLRPLQDVNRCLKPA